MHSGDATSVGTRVHVARLALHRSSTPHTSAKKYPGVLDSCRTNVDEDGTRTRATFVTRKLIAKQC